MKSDLHWWNWAANIRRRHGSRCSTTVITWLRAHLWCQWLRLRTRYTWIYTWIANWRHVRRRCTYRRHRQHRTITHRSFKTADAACYFDAQKLKCQQDGAGNLTLGHQISSSHKLSHAICLAYDQLSIFSFPSWRVFSSSALYGRHWCCCFLRVKYIKPDVCIFRIVANLITAYFLA